MKYSNRFFDINFPDAGIYVSSLPMATKIITVSYVTLTVLLYILRMAHYQKLGEEDDIQYIVVPILELIPSKVLQYPTSIVLSNLVDIVLWRFILTLLNLVMGGSFIERNWGSTKELFIFILGLGSITNCFIVLVTYLLASVFPGVRLDVPLDGNYTILIGFPIIYRQLLPETTIIDIKYPNILSKNFRFKLLPIFVLCVMTFMQLIWFHHFAQLISLWVTFFVTWIYLRFYQRLPALSNSGSTIQSEIIVGDASDTFQLIYFFPDFMKPVLRPVFDVSYKFFCEKLRIIKPFDADDIDKGNQVAVSRGAKTADDAIDDIEAGSRRRELALKVLNQRMDESQEAS
ncbi:Uncharacterized protein RNJ44_01937 [Nakaseomyces bracarensis]|uniref:Uncharacterized protein n=1 Tax=Nakaseomyces bracarensis TaxID=273131 RepID=A0ABR4NPF6_9SACH